MYRKNKFSRELKILTFLFQNFSSSQNIHKIYRLNIFKRVQSLERNKLFLYIYMIQKSSWLTYQQKQSTTDHKSSKRFLFLNFYECNITEIFI